MITVLPGGAPPSAPTDDVTQLETRRRRYLVMKENATLTDPAARLLAVSASISNGLSPMHASLGRSLTRAASSLLITCLKTNTRTPSGAERARAAACRCLHLLQRLDQHEAADEGVLQKALTLADRVLRALPEPETQTRTLPLEPTGRGRTTLSLIPLAVTGSRNP